MADPNDIKTFTTAVEDAVSYPILTSDVNGGRGGGRNDEPPGSSGAGSVTNTAQQTIRQLLGWRYRSNDTKGFVAALNRAFDLKQTEGHTEWEWKPQNYMVQADLGEITGAQASILSRANVAVGQALPLLDGLTPLRDDANDDEMESVRSIVRSALTQLLREFGAARGPRVQRVEDFFDQLLGASPDPGSPELVGGQLGVLRERFGLDRNRVNTIAEEQNLTNSLILVDYVITLWQTWMANRKYFDRLRQAEPFLGTQLVLLSQSLESVAESVCETYEAMDSVFFGAVERQTTSLPFPKTNGKSPSPLTVAELLGWVEDFATGEARQLIQDAGKDGVGAARRTLRQLRDLVSAARTISESDTGSPARGFHSNRVRRALQELETQLVKAHELASDVRPAVLLNVEPPEVRIDVNARIRITLIGEGFGKDGKVVLMGPDGQEVEALSSTPITSTRLLAQFDQTSSKFRTGSWNVRFTPEDGPSVTLTGKLTIVVPAPEIKTVGLDLVTMGGKVNLTINGMNFRAPMKVTLVDENKKGIPPKGGEVDDSSEILAEFENVPLGKFYTVLIENADGQTDSSEKFEIKLADPPTITRVNPLTGKQGHKDVPVEIVGDNLKSSTKIAFGQKIQVTPKELDAHGHLHAEIDIAGDAPKGKRDVIVTNPDEQSATLKDGFTVG